MDSRTMVVIWLALVALFAVGEMVTTKLVSIWFAFGSLCALLSAFLAANGAVQCVVFLASSAALLAAAQLLIRRYRSRHAGGPALRNKPPRRKRFHEK